MEPMVRRSHLLVSARDEAQVDMSWKHAADAVILDMADAVPEVEKPRARAGYSKRQSPSPHAGGLRCLCASTKSWRHARYYGFGLARSHGGRRDGG